MGIYLDRDETDFRQTFDYRPLECLEIDTEFDKLNLEQRKRLDEALKQIKEETEQIVAEYAKEWIYATILPILKNYAEENRSLLAVRSKGNNLIMAELRCAAGFHIAEKHFALKTIFGLARHIEICTHDEEVALLLTFDCTKTV